MVGAKTFFLAVACGAVAVYGSEDIQDEGQVVEEKPTLLEELEQLAHAAGEEEIDWEKFSPDNIGLRLDFENMTEEERRHIAESLVGFIKPEEVDKFQAALASPQIRQVSQAINANFPTFVKSFLSDPNYQRDIEAAKEQFTPDMLKALLGIDGDLKEGLQNIINRIDETQDSDL